MFVNVNGPLKPSLAVIIDEEVVAVVDVVSLALVATDESEELAVLLGAGVVPEVTAAEEATSVLLVEATELALATVLATLLTATDGATLLATPDTVETAASVVQLAIGTDGV